MELIWNEYGAERLFERRTVQVRVEGALPTPDANAVAEVITCGGRVFMIGAEEI